MANRRDKSKLNQEAVQVLYRKISSSDAVLEMPNAVLREVFGHIVAQGRIINQQARDYKKLEEVLDLETEVAFENGFDLGTSKQGGLP